MMDAAQDSGSPCAVGEQRPSYCFAIHGDCRSDTLHRSFASSAGDRTRNRHRRHRRHRLALPGRVQAVQGGLWTNPLVVDSDADGLGGGDEVNRYKTDPLNPDTDGDGLRDQTEIDRHKTDPTKPDTDGDGIIDSEDDCPLIKGIANSDEGRNGCPPAPKIGTKVDFPDILFVVNTDEFNFDVPETDGNLAKLFAYINQCEKLGVQIEEHASSEGNPKRNQELSDLRAKKVVRWLIDQGVNPGKLLGAIGFGSSKPAVREPSASEAKKKTKEEIEAIRKKNRRITVVVRKGCDS